MQIPWIICSLKLVAGWSKMGCAGPAPIVALADHALICGRHSAAQGVPVAGHGHNRQNIFFQIEIEWVFDYRMNKFEAFLMLINHH